MIDSEVTSTVAAAGGQYAQAKHIVGPVMAFNVGLYLVFAYTMLEAANAITLGYLVQTVGSMAGFENVHDKPFIVLTIMFLAWLNYRGVYATLDVQPRSHGNCICRHHHSVRMGEAVVERTAQASATF